VEVRGLVERWGGSLFVNVKRGEGGGWVALWAFEWDHVGGAEGVRGAVVDAWFVCGFFIIGVDVWRE